MVTREDIARGLSDIGLPRNAVVLVHSSLSSMGYVKGGAESVVDALLDHLGPGGTLVVPTLPFRGYQYDYLSEDPLFDPRTTPSLTGRIPEAVRMRRDALRSWHPSHSVSAIGPAAMTLIAPQLCEPWLTFGPESPFGRLIDLGGWICLLGVSHWCSTFLHVVEEQNHLDYFALPNSMTGRVLLDGQVVHINTSVGRPRVVRAFERVEPLLVENDALTFGRIGMATVRLMRAKSVMLTVSAALERQPYLLLPQPWHT